MTWLYEFQAWGPEGGDVEAFAPLLTIKKLRERGLLPESYVNLYNVSGPNVDAIMLEQKRVEAEREQNRKAAAQAAGAVEPHRDGGVREQVVSDQPERKGRKSRRKA